MTSKEKKEVRYLIKKVLKEEIGNKSTVFRILGRMLIGVIGSITGCVLYLVKKLFFCWLGLLTEINREINIVCSKLNEQSKSKGN